MRPLLLALLALFLLAQPAAAAPKCPKGSAIAISKPRACLPKSGRIDGPLALKPLLKLAPKPPKGSRANRRTERLARRMVAARFGATARAARQDNLFGRQVSERTGADGVTTARFERPDGVDVTVRATERNGGVVELRDRSGAGHTLGMQGRTDLARCPKADGDVPGTFDRTFTYGQATARTGKRDWTLVTSRAEATVTAHVGVGGKVETYDFTLRGELSIRSGVEIAATGKALKRNPTRTYRSFLSRQRVPVGTDVAGLVKAFTLRGPKGARALPEDIQPYTGLLTISVMGLTDIVAALEQGDQRWYENRACATLDYTWAPEKVVKGGRADYDLKVFAEDGAPPAAAKATVGSNCGTASTAAYDGSGFRFAVEDTGGAWGPNPYQGSCVSVDITSTAGRPRIVHHSIPPLEAQRYRYTFTVDFSQTMGADVAPTEARGTATVTLGPEDGFVDGTGTFSGSEWDGTLTNPCGHDMLRTRTFSSPVAFGGEVRGDQVTLAFTAVERPLVASWIVTLPVTGGTRTFTSRQPFCGTPDLALRTANITVSASPVAT
jgi:hypothetical protein